MSGCQGVLQGPERGGRACERKLVRVRAWACSTELTPLLELARGTVVHGPVWGGQQRAGRSEQGSWESPRRACCCRKD